MAFHVPTQTRAVDPFSSYNSNNVNQLTRIISKGNDVIAQGMGISILNSTTVQVQDGVIIKDDVMINIQEVLDIDLTDSGWIVEGTPVGVDTTGYIYVIAIYDYQKVSPANTCSIKILKDTSSFGSHPEYMFLKAIELNPGVGTVADVLDYDPDNPTIAKQSASVNVTPVSRKILLGTSILYASPS